MKKIILNVLLITMLLSLISSNVFAFTKSENIESETIYSSMNECTNTTEEIQPFYVAAQVVKIGFSIQSGKAICSAQITPKTTNSITSIKGTFKIINNSGKTIKTYTQNMKKIGNNYYFSVGYKLPSKGTYYMQASMTCYKNGIKQEKITKTSSKQSY